MRVNWLFAITVLLPTLVSMIYFGWVASDIYISEARFVVRTPQRSQQPTVIGALLQGSSFLRSQDDSFTVHDYMLSRDALKELDAKLNLRAAFANDSVDYFNRFPGPFSEDKFELLYKHYIRRVTVDFDSTTSITTLRVNAFSKEDSQRINESLLQLGEALVNQINVRGREDLIRFAQAEVSEAEAKAKVAALALAGYRNERTVFDPERQSIAQLQQINKLQDELIAAKTQLSQVQMLSPQNPQVRVLQQRVKLMQREVATETAKITGGGDNTLSNKASMFERLSLERTFADRQLASAMSSLEAARNEARRKQLYLERIVQPNAPDYPLEPRRVRTILATFVFGLIVWGCAAMLVASVREHQD